MTTEAGLAGLLTGLTATMILICPLAIAWSAGSTHWVWITVVVAAVITIGGDWMAGTGADLFTLAVALLWVDWQASSSSACWVQGQLD